MFEIMMNYNKYEWKISIIIILKNKGILKSLIYNIHIPRNVEYKNTYTLYLYIVQKMKLIYKKYEFLCTTKNYYLYAYKYNT
ncbi:hypothetical protein PFBG_01686 [Plasmodium falciparum 7G8]|uniref:Uncharacterized protein n=2 Tax=Plasmodium falciparum TaxID=5833 RepID=A0A024WB06_PLAFA|nr:hypothetical protein PFTANZ_01751 [Plasmodium falciparum Tanzania (2000708)]EUR74085.1 hypothetical protein PFBG_01686 [Plasmodium falciparum 7G8]